MKVRLAAVLTASVFFAVGGVSLAASAAGHHHRSHHHHHHQVKHPYHRPKVGSAHPGFTG